MDVNQSWHSVSARTSPTCLSSTVFWESPSVLSYLGTLKRVREFEFLKSKDNASFTYSQSPHGHKFWVHIIWIFPGFYYGLLNQDTPYHNSALHSLFLQQIMQITDGMDFKDFTAYLSPLSRTLITAFMGVPFDNTEDRSLQGLFSPNHLLENVKPVSLFTNKVLAFGRNILI